MFCYCYFAFLQKATFSNPIPGKMLGKIKWHLKIQVSLYCSISTFSCSFLTLFFPIYLNHYSESFKNMCMRMCSSPYFMDKTELKDKFLIITVHIKYSVEKETVPVAKISFIKIFFAFQIIIFHAATLMKTTQTLSGNKNNFTGKITFDHSS